MLLHGGGGGQSRQSWHQAGYVDRLKGDFQVITIDIRGHGESDKLIDPVAYKIDIMCQDILAVADGCGVDKFALWGFSYGGNIGRYLATRSDRVAKLIIMGIPFGPAASGEFRQSILELRSHWTPLLQQIQTGTLDPASFSREDEAMWQQLNVPATLAWLTAMLDWGDNEPADLPCPTLWLSGSENESTMDSIKVYESELEKTNVIAHIVEGIDHAGEFEQIDLVFPIMKAFTIS
jgi:pimeloyl-ACP methyl ester carboxylesterase